MTSYFVTRHSGALDWARQQGIPADVRLDHLDTEIIAPGDTVIGSMPVNLVARICQRGGRYFHLSLELPKEWRGRELTVEEMSQCGAKLEEFHVHAVHAKE